MQASASWQEAFLVEAFGTLRRFETNEAQVPAEVQSSHLVIPHEHTAHALELQEHPRASFNGLHPKAISKRCTVGILH